MNLSPSPIKSRMHTCTVCPLSQPPFLPSRPTRHLGVPFFIPDEKHDVFSWSLKCCCIYLIPSRQFFWLNCASFPPVFHFDFGNFKWNIWGRSTVEMNINEPKYGGGFALPSFHTKKPQVDSHASQSRSLKSNRLPFLGWIPDTVSIRYDLLLQCWLPVRLETILLPPVPNLLEQLFFCSSHFLGHKLLF